MGTKTQEDHHRQSAMRIAKRCITCTSNHIQNDTYIYIYILLSLYGIWYAIPWFEVTRMVIRLPLFHPPVVLRFQRVPMAASGGDGESEPPELSAGLKQFLEKLREGLYNRHDGGTSKTNIEAPRLLNFSQETKS